MYKFFRLIVKISLHGNNVKFKNSLKICILQDSYFSIYKNHCIETMKVISSIFYEDKILKSKEKKKKKKSKFTSLFGARKLMMHLKRHLMTIIYTLVEYLSCITWFKRKKKITTYIYMYYKIFSNRRCPNCDTFIMFISRYLFTGEIVLTKASDLAISFQHLYDNLHISYLVLRVWLSHVYYVYSSLNNKRLLNASYFNRNIDTIMLTSYDRSITTFKIMNSK